MSSMDRSMECCVCWQKNMNQTTSDSHFKLNCTRYVCCGALTCIGCYETMSQDARDKLQRLLCPLCRIEWPRNNEERFDQCMIRANENRSWALELIAQFYHQGSGVKEDKTKAVEFFKRAADLGESLSCCNLATAYLYGEGVEKNIEKALYYYQIGASKGDDGCSCTLGIIYLKGDGVVKDVEKGLPYLTSAAEKGYKLAQVVLASYLKNGENGVPKSPVQAIYWYRMFLKDNKVLDEFYNMAKESLERLLSIQKSHCSCCGHKAKLSLQCSKCMSVYYCNVVCQRKHWNNGHKQECKKVE